MKIIADSAIPFLEGAIDPYGTVVRQEGAKISAADVRDADALLIRTRTRCNAALLDGSRVKFIGSATIGYDHIDMDYCRKAGIGVFTAQGCNAMGVAHYFVSVLAHLSVRSGTLGVIGVGNVGKKIARIGELLGFRVLLNDPPRAEREPGFRQAGLPELLRESDIVTLHVPYTRSGRYPTENLAGTDFFGSLKPGAVFVNTSRGEAVDETALLRALENGTVSQACLDVWRNEPAIDLRLLEAATLATPHIAGYSVQGKANGTAAVVRAFAGFYGIEALKDWYPEGIRRTDFLPEDGRELLSLARSRYDIAADDCRLRRDPGDFERLRNGYDYREEYFTLP